MDEKTKWDLVDKKLLKIVKNGDIEELKKSFPDAEALSMVASYCSEEVKRDSLLAMIVKHSNAEFLKKVVDEYFPEDVGNPDLLNIKRNVFKGTDVAGNSFNYHYFREWLPFMRTAFVDKMYNSKLSIRPLFNKVFSGKEQERMLELYNVIRKNRIRTERQLNGGHIDSFALPMMEVSPDGNPSMSALVRTNNGETTKVYKEHDYPVIVMRKISGKEELNDYVVPLLFVKGENSDDPLTRRAYEQLDFPDIFVMMARDLKVMDKEWNMMLEDEYMKPLTETFIKDGGYLRLENKHDPKANIKKINDKDEGLYSGYAGYDNKWRSRIVINCDSQSGHSTNILPHEIAHRADLSKDVNFSDNGIISYTWMMISLDEDKSSDRESIHEKLMRAYKPSDYNCESIANIVQYARFKSKGHDKDHLMRNVYKLFGHFSDAKNNDYAAILKRIDSITSRLTDRNDLFELNKLFKKYLKDNFEYEKSLVEDNEVSGGKLDLSYSRLSAAKNKGAYGKKGHEGIERQLSADIVDELRKIQQIMRNKEACKAIIPEQYLDIKTDAAQEIIVLNARKAAQDSSGNIAAKMRKVYDELDIGTLTGELGDRAFNDKFLYAMVYNNEKLDNSDLRHIDTEDFKDRDTLLGIMEKHIEKLELSEKYLVPYRMLQVAEELKIEPETYINMVAGVEEDIADCKDYKSAAKSIDQYGYNTGDTRGSIRFVAAANMLYSEISGDTELVSYHSQSSLDYAVHQAKIFNDNLRMTDQGLSYEAVAAMGRAVNLKNIENKVENRFATINEKDLDTRFLDKSVSEINRMTVFMAMREIQKRNFPKDPMPDDLKLEIFNKGNLKGYNRGLMLQPILSKHLQRFKDAGVFGSDGYIKQEMLSNNIWNMSLKGKGKSTK